MIYRAPEYVKKFKCAAGDCRDSCCIGWEITADRQALEKYAALRTSLGADIRASLTKDGIFRLREDGRCPHLLENGLCRIICEEGEGLLCEICREHPRFYNTVGDLCEWGISLACESAAELILSEKLPLSFYDSEKEDEESEPIDDALLSLLLSRREAMLSLICDRRSNANDLLFSLENMAHSLQDFIDNADICNESFTFNNNKRAETPFLCEERFSKYKKLILSLEVLSEEWRPRCEKIEMQSIPAEREELLRQLLTYFIYRYMICAAYDGDLQGRIGFSVFSAIWILLLCESEGRKDERAIAEAAKDFSKEVECSEENVCSVLDAFSAFGLGE